MKFRYADKVWSEELIEYHDAEFEIIDGYYYIEGRTNNNVNHAIEDLHNLKAKMKKDKSSTDCY